MKKTTPDKALPDFIEIFRIVRNAGRSDRDKAMALWQRLEISKAALRGDLS